MAVARIGAREYPTKAKAQQAVQQILQRYRASGRVTAPEDDLLLRDLLAMHPDAEERIGPGVDHFRVIPTPRGNHYGPEAVLVNGEHVAFSYKKCLEPPTHKQRVLDAMRTEAEAQVNAYFQARQAAGTLVSDRSGIPLTSDDVNVAYFQGPRFHDLATTFAAGAGGWNAITLESDTARGLALFADRDLAARWHDHHREHAVLGLLSKAENRTRPH